MTESIPAGPSSGDLRGCCSTAPGDPHVTGCTEAGAPDSVVCGLPGLYDPAVCPCTSHALVRDAVIREAIGAFWYVVSTRYPLPSGDLDPAETVAFETAARNAVHAWTIWNATPATR